MFCFRQPRRRNKRPSVLKDLYGKLIEKIERRLAENSIELPAIEKELQLDILVDGMGRVNFDKTIIDRKGITEKVELKTNSGTIELKN